MLREPLVDHLVQLVVFVATEKTQPAAAFLALAHEPSGIHAHFSVAHAFPVARETKALYRLAVAAVLQCSRSHRSSSCGVTSAAWREPVLANDDRFALVIAVVLMVRHKFQGIIDQFADRDYFGIAQFGQLPSRSGIGLAGLVKLDCVRLPSDLFTVPLSPRVIVNPPNSAAFRIFVYTPHQIRSDGCSIGLSVSPSPTVQPSTKQIPGRSVFPLQSVPDLSTIVLEMRTQLASVGDLLFGQTRGRVLALLYGAPDEPLFVRQIARLAETSVGTVQRELALLTDAGLIKRSALGSQVFYQANQEHPDFPELRALLAKTAGVFQMLKAALAPFSARINLAFVYGSVARAEEKATSDIDLMVIGAVSLDEVLEAVGPVEKQLRRPVNPTIYSLEDLKARIRSGNHFLQSLKKSKKVFLIGDEDEFRKASTTRLVQG